MYFGSPSQAPHAVGLLHQMRAIIIWKLFCTMKTC